MNFVLYDRKLKSIGELYPATEWSRIQRAVDFDEMTIVGSGVPLNEKPFIIVMLDKKGHPLFSGLVGTLSRKKSGKSDIPVKDYLTLLNSDVFIDWIGFDGTTASQYINFVMAAWSAQVDTGFVGRVTWNTDDVKDVLLDPIFYGTSESHRENVLAYDLIKGIVDFHEIYVETKLNIDAKTLTFYFKRAYVVEQELNLRDTELDFADSSFGDYNTVSIYKSSGEWYQSWGLTVNNNIIKLPAEDPDILVYPKKNRNFVASEPTDESLFDAVYDALTGLAQNRYQENIDLPSRQYSSFLDLTKVDFSYAIKVYSSLGYDRVLPVGEIETDSKGKHIVRLGYRIQELTQEG